MDSVVDVLPKPPTLARLAEQTLQTFFRLPQSFSQDYAKNAKEELKAEEEKLYTNQHEVQGYNWILRQQG